MGLGDNFAPRITKKPVIRQEDDGRKLVFQCSVEAYPAPEVSWFQGATDLFMSKRTLMRMENVTENEYVAIMELADVNAKDAGTFNVTARNSSGEATASINLNFSGKLCICLSKQ